PPRRSTAASGRCTPPRSWRAHLPVPVDRPPQPFLQRVARLQPDEAIGALGARGPPRVPAALARVERDPARVAGEPGDEVHEVADADLPAGGEVHALRALEPLGGEHEAGREVLDVEEVARGRAVAPDDELGLVEALADGGRDDVRDRRIEAVARAVGVG